MARHTSVNASADFLRNGRGDEEKIQGVLDAELDTSRAVCPNKVCVLRAEGKVDYLYGDPFYQFEASCKPSCEGCGKRILDLIDRLDESLTVAGVLSEGDEICRLTPQNTEDTGSVVNEYDTEF